jgi:signal transduction histidine kinase
MDRNSDMARILIVDDEEGLRTSLVTAFRREGYEVAGADSGEAALAQLRQAPPDILLTDLVMPGMDGIDLMEHARRECPAILTILMTAGGTVESAIRALKGGAFDYVQKPFSFAEIFHLARRGMEQQRLRQENLQLSEINRRLSEIDELKSSLLSAMTHEFRTPLTLMQGWLEMLLAGQLGTLSAEQRESVRAVSRGAVRLGRLVANLLAFVECERGQAVRQRFPVSLPGLVEAVTRQLVPDCAERGVSLDVDAPADLPAVLGDGERLQLLLFNLVENAVKFNEPGGRVVVRAGREEAVLVVSIVNTRGEIAPERLPRLLQPFTQGDMRSTRAAGGLGLGLSVARAILDAHGGGLSVDTGRGQGTTVRVVLPLAGEPEPRP